MMTPIARSPSFASMCGIAGILGPGADAETVTRMTRALAHRGPDDEGIWIEGDAELAFGHRRLAIIDPSPAGHQPMLSPSGRYVITFNGEIYNHADLRLELEGSGQKLDWRGHSDTETLLACFELWGIKSTLQRASGMFALALWDQKQRVLTLARDRLGEKPLYYGRLKGRDGAFLFASELKAFNQHPGFVPEIDPEALRLFVRYLAVPAPLSIYRGILKLLPGTMLTLRRSVAEPIVEEYWSGAEVARIGAANPIRLSPEEAADDLERVLERAVGRQMIADVPLGAFLSGGIDSSTVVAIMQKLSPQPVKTFTIGFHEQAYNEAEHAKAVARQLGTDHRELYVTPEQAMAIIPRLPTMYDEPFADSSQIPTHLVSALAAGEVKVALSGDGGDELFGGYDRYLITAGLWDKIAGIPRPFRAFAAKALTMVPVNAWTRLGDAAGGLLPRTIRLKRLGDKVHKGADMLCSESLDSLYDDMLSLWRDPQLVIGAPQGNPSQPAAVEQLGELGGVERMMALDMLGYLTNDILVKVDRAAMAVSLETRVPLLDPELVEFAWRLPLDMKIRGGTTKWLLRKVLSRHVPEKLIDRPKMGFGIPLDSWLRGPLRDWAEALLDERKLSEQGFFSPSQIRSSWDGH
ncbi:MAG TPA: asparagine synthase (glutamine-hydrolyzing), partial [Sphingomicrobium sp.]|nr:asparagine synthase (glutamine-hydrolyzing) [Sphingomicrobium sp.]